jgi:protein phosphatase
LTIPLPFRPTDERLARTAQQADDDTLDLADVIGKRLIDTRLLAPITIREEDAIAALEVMSRFATVSS